MAIFWVETCCENGENNAFSRHSCYDYPVISSLTQTECIPVELSKHVKRTALTNTHK
jgi:hypothetical protein